jgi:hypothetical protein
MKKLLVILLAIAMVGAFSIPAYAATEFSFKGDARMETFYVSQDDDLGFNGEEDDDLRWTKSNVLSRLGIKAVRDNITGYIEIRPHTGSYVRHWFGEWNFGSGKLLVGKTWTPATVFTNSSNYKDNTMGGFGNMNWAAARIDQIRLTFLDGNLKLGFLDVNDATSIPNPIGPSFGSHSDTTLPTIEASYTLKLKPVKLVFNGGYATYDVREAVTDNEETIDSNFFGLAAFFDIGAFYVKAEGHIATNGANYGLNYNGLSFASAGWDAADSKVVDNDSVGYQFIVGWQASEDLILEAGYGFVEAELDISGPDPDDASMIYINAPINLAGGVLLTPEIGVIDYMDNILGEDQGTETFFGATWKISF